MVRDAQGRIVMWNLGAEKLYGYTKQEALGQLSHELLKTEFPEPLPQLEEKLARDGFVRARIDGDLCPLDDPPRLDKRKNHTIEVLIDRLLVKAGIAGRLEQSIATALKLAKGLVTVVVVGGTEQVFSEKMACSECGVSVPQLEPRSFSFNSPYGACPACNGLGSKYDFDPSKIISDWSRPLFDGGLGLHEITLRTKAGLPTIAALAREIPGLLVGAGSVLTPDLGQAAIYTGAHFLVSPGTTETLLEFAATCRVPFLPGAGSTSEAMRLLIAGCSMAKLFPAELLGGTRFLRAIAGPLPSMKFCPTGGISATTAPDYLKLGNVVAVGGSWMAPDDLIKAKNFTEIRRLAQHAASF